MHAQRCPVAKLRAASQQQQSQVGHKGGTTRLSAPLQAKKKQDKTRQSQLSKTQEKPSFFQNVHGDAAPLLPPRPQMYSEEHYAPPRTRLPAHPNGTLTHPNYHKEAIRHKRPTRPVYSKDQAITIPQPSTHHPHYKDSKPLSHVYYKEAVNPRKKDTVDQELFFNQKCIVHGQSKPFRCSVPKSMSCPSSRQTTDVERLKNWRRNSLTLTPSMTAYSLSSRPCSSTTSTSTNNTAPNNATKEKRPRPLSQGHELPPLHPGRMAAKQHVPSRALNSPSTITSPPTSQTKSIEHTNDPQDRRSQFRRAWSLFSMGCHESHKKAPPQSILRQPTRYLYRRGISGLPVECTSRDMGVVF